MLSFPMGKLAFSHSGNRGQKTFALSTQMHHFLDFWAKKTELVATAKVVFSTSKKPRKRSWYARKRGIAKSENHVQKTFVFPMKF